MSINIFEGARRIALIFGALWAAGGIAYAVFHEPYASTSYIVPTLGAKPVLAIKCGDNDAQAYPDSTTPWGEKLKASVILCFSTHKTDSGEYLVPYAPAEDGRLWVGDKYSPVVTRYTKEVAENFAFTDEVLAATSKAQHDARMEQWRNALIFVLAGLAGGWLLVAAIGWVFRGFLGIPRGRDAVPRQATDVPRP